MQKKLFQEVTSMLRLRKLIVYYLKLSRDRRTPISAFLKRLSTRFNGHFFQKALWRSKGHRKSFILNLSDVCLLELGKHRLGVSFQNNLPVNAILFKISLPTLSFFNFGLFRWFSGRSSFCEAVWISIHLRNIRFLNIRR